MTKIKNLDREEGVVIQQGLRSKTFYSHFKAVP
jgi:hypothetical protein